MMFTVAHKILQHRARIAIDCKTLTKTQSVGTLLNGRERVMAAAYRIQNIPIGTAVMELRDSIVHGRTTDGGWTNGFIYLSPSLSVPTGKVSIRFSGGRHLLGRRGERGLFACLLFHRELQGSPFVGFVTHSRTTLFVAKHFDAVVSYCNAKRKLNELSLYLNYTKLGLMVWSMGEPMAFLMKASIPVTMRSQLTALTEVFYENCRNRPESE